MKLIDRLRAAFGAATRPAFAGLVVFVALATGIAGAAVRHVPPAAATAASPLELVVQVSETTPAPLVAHYRTAGSREFVTMELVRRDDTTWVAVVPATAVVAPGLEYYLDAGNAPVFASPAWPHTTPVGLSESDDRRARDSARAQQRRSRVHTSGELVNFGTRTADGVTLEDQYYRIDADFAYRLWAYPLEQIRVGYTRLVGNTESTMCEATLRCTAEAGYKVAGWFELGLAPIEGLHTDVRAMVMATQQGFAIGGRGEVRLGMIDASHVAAGVEYMADVGSAGYFRLGWGTVPKLPMAATVEVTNLPASTSATGVRVFYDIARDVGGGVRIGARVGYAARNQTVAGFTGGGNLSVDF
ncbi:MAG: hypothetical protein ABI867_30870 [Kofleriaceae bacterium]